jgi:hypothetical protein
MRSITERGQDTLAPRQTARMVNDTSEPRIVFYQI